MAPEGKPLVIALEEHYYDPEVAKTFDGPEGRAPEIRRRLDDLGELRLKEMDEAGIRIPGGSHGAPFTQPRSASDGRGPRPGSAQPPGRADSAPPPPLAPAS